MEKKYNNMVFAEIDLDFDSDQFAQEYDQYILPNLLPFVPVHTQWRRMKQLNKTWHLISDDEFEKYDAIVESGGTEFDGMTHYWVAMNLMQAQTGDNKDGFGAGWRHANLDKVTSLKPQFKDLGIVDWIHHSIPNDRIVGIHCVSIKPGHFASMHRDAYWNDNTQPNPALQNGFFRRGFIVLCLNISDGGAPLLWAMDHEQSHPRSVNAKCYVCSDHFVHGVPRVTSLRRQIRVSFKPNDEFWDLVKSDTIITVPEDYQYQD